MLDNTLQAGFSQETLTTMNDPRIRKDENGYFIMSLSENSKVYFEDFYRFMEMTFDRANEERNRLNEKIAKTGDQNLETLSYYRARGVVIDLLMRTIKRFYADNSNFGIIMTPWCFGTVVLEKIEVYKERISRGEVEDPNIVDYPYYIVKYIEEIYKITLLEMFDFPETAFQMRWQYSELLKKYSKILTNITGSLNSVLSMIKNYNR